MDLLVICRDERLCDLCSEDAVVELHRPPVLRRGYLSLCAGCLTIDLLERRTFRRVAAATPLLRSA